MRLSVRRRTAPARQARPRGRPQINANPAGWCVPSTPTVSGPTAIRTACRMLRFHFTGPFGGTHALSDRQDLTRRIRQVVGEHGHLPVDIATIDDDTDLFQAGMTSHASVNVMLGLESEFDVEFPDAMLK